MNSEYQQKLLNGLLNAINERDKRVYTFKIKRRHGNTFVVDQVKRSVGQRLLVNKKFIDFPEGVDTVLTEYDSELILYLK